jgi:adenosine 3'-phospho 5'-phosphosulfate transporter B2
MLGVGVLFLIQAVMAQEDSSTESFWVFRLATNMMGYASIIVPAIFLKRYLDSRNYKDGGSGFWYPYLVNFFYGKDLHDVEQGAKDTVSPAPKPQMTTLQIAIKLCFCAGGLYSSYLTWGVLQERIITRKYGANENNEGGEKFTDSQFLVFINRFSALIIAGCYLQMKRQPKHGCPFYKYSFCSLSNILSSWFQYEALKFVSFPTQVLAKACKVIPVMLMGKVVSGNKYPLFDWATAAQLGVGTSIFLLSNHDDSGDGSTTTFSGLLCLMGYMLFDSFTSNWQSEVFKYKMSSMEMMFGVNVFSCIFTSWSLISQGSFAVSLGFMLRHPDFTFHAIVLSACSALGQLFIYYTISEFGAVVFTIIMTTRSALAIILSCIIYGHPVNGQGAFGLLVAFSSLGLRIWYKMQQKKKAQQQKEDKTPLLGENK